MTIAELNRSAASKRRIMEAEDKKKAIADYTLANLIGRSIARIYSASNQMPTLAEVYPHLFSKEEEEKIQQERKDNLSVLRFKQFAQSYNKKFKKEG